MNINVGVQCQSAIISLFDHAGYLVYSSIKYMP